MFVIGYIYDRRWVAAADLRFELKLSIGNKHEISLAYGFIYCIRILCLRLISMEKKKKGCIKF